MWLLCIVVTLIYIKFYNKLYSGKCYSDSIMSGKVVIITGGNSGIGYETALELARRGAKVILGCRDDVKGKNAVDTIRKATKNNSVRYLPLDLSSLKSVRAFVDEFQKSEAKLDVLVNNAGVCGEGQDITEDGILKNMQINHFGPFLLTVLLVPLLKKSGPSRVVIVSSNFHKYGTVDRINEKCLNYFKAYCDSKLYNVLFSKELSRRLEGSGVVVNSLHPGQVNTSLYKRTVIEKIRSLILFTFFKNPKEGAQTSVHLAISEDCDQVTGKYFADCKETSPSSKAMDWNSATRLWNESEKLVKLGPEEVIR